VTATPPARGRPPSAQHRVIDAVVFAIVSHAGISRSAVHARLLAQRHLRLPDDPEATYRSLRRLAAEGQVERIEGTNLWRRVTASEREAVRA